MTIADFNHIKDVLDALDTNKPARFAYTQNALDATGSAEISALTGVYAVEDSSQINSIPTPEQVAMDSLVMSIGLRSQAATLSRMMINHFFGRLGLNLVKTIEKTKLLVNDHLVNRYITPSGNVLEDVGVGYTTDVITLVKHRSPLSASAPVTASAAVSLVGAVYSGNAGVMTGADKKVLDDLNSTTAVKITGDQTIEGIKTFSSDLKALRLLAYGAGDIDSNVAIGTDALGVNTTGIDNVAIGKGALDANTEGLDNIAIGTDALGVNITGSYNVAIGRNSLKTNAGHFNIAIGLQAMEGNTTGSSNIAIGYNALKINTTGSSNIAIGKGALDSNTTGSDNIAIGGNVLNYNTSGQHNVCIGGNVGIVISSDDNTGVGYGSLTNCTTGTGNTTFGYNSGRMINIGMNNVCIGNNAGAITTTGNNNIAIGYNASPSTAIISNTITLGNSSIATLRCQVTTITALSDKRDKKDIEDSPAGLNIINAVRPTIFKWDMREWYEDGISDGSKKSDKYTLNFIAQELKEVQESYNMSFLNLVNEDNPERLEATPGNLLPVIVKAIQELSKKIDDLETKIKTLS